MTNLKSIRFQKFDKFNNMVFIVNGENPKEVDNYNLLKKYADSLKQKYDSFLPIYYNSEYKYCTIRFFKNTNLKPELNCTYDIDFKIREKVKDDSNRAGFAQKFVNCYLEKLIFVSRKKIDQGEEIEL